MRSAHACIDLENKGERFDQFNFTVAFVKLRTLNFLRLVREMWSFIGILVYIYICVCIGAVVTERTVQVNKFFSEK